LHSHASAPIEPIPSSGSDGASGDGPGPQSSSAKSLASYPFVHRVGGSDPLWRIAPDQLEAATLDDSERISELVESLRRALDRVDAASGLIGNELVDTLGAGDRKKLRELWWQVFEPVLDADYACAVTVLTGAPVALRLCPPGSPDVGRTRDGRLAAT